MPKKQHSKGRPFVKGDPRIGRRALPPAVQHTRHVAFVEFNIIALELFSLPYSEVVLIGNNEETRTDKKMIARAIMLGANGNQASSNAVWDRVYGRPPETIKHEEINAGPDISKLPLEKLKQIRDILKSVKPAENA